MYEIKVNNNSFQIIVTGAKGSDGSGGVTAASQGEVNTGTEAAKYVSPLTFEGASKWSTKADASHTHVKADITDFAHTHPQSDITNLVSDLGNKLSNIVEDTTPQLGGELDANSNSIINLSDITFKTGATGGTVRTGTSAADKFQLQAYKTGAGAGYQKVLQSDAGASPTLEVFANSFGIWDDTDETKKLIFSLSGESTGVVTTMALSSTANRVITFPDATGTLALTSDLTGYAFKAGVSGGQTLIGGTGVTDALTLQGTSANGTLTDKALKVLVGNAGSTEAFTIKNNGYIDVAERINFGTTTGTGRINLPNTGTTSADGIWFGSGVSMYRQAADRIAISNRLLVTGDLTLGGVINDGFGGDIVMNGTTGLNLQPSTITGSSATSALSITQTWNTSGNPSAILLNITNTASGASANLMDLKVGGSSVFKVDKAGIPSINGNAGVSGTFTTVDGKTVTVTSGLITSIV